MTGTDATTWASKADMHGTGLYIPKKHWVILKQEATRRDIPLAHLLREIIEGYLVNNGDIGAPPKSKGWKRDGETPD